MYILGPSRTTLARARTWARKHSAADAFVRLADLYWRLAPHHGSVVPEVAYAQAAHETGLGRFGGAVLPSFHNPAGLKVPRPEGDAPGDHSRFPDWETGVAAHLDHLALYAGAAGYPRARTPDPRHFPHLLGTARTVKALGTRWAPSPDYGQLIATIIEEIRSTPKEEAGGAMQYVTRQQWGARAPHPRSPLLAQDIEGVAVHYTGGSNAYEKGDHAECPAAVRSIQNFHMDSRGWADIAYNWLVCIHGFVFEGRGWGVRSAAQGSTHGNDAFHAVCFLGNDDRGVDVTPGAARALVRVIQESRRRYPDATDVQPHSHFTATSCPGDELRAWILREPWEASGAPRDGFWKWLHWYGGTGPYKDEGAREGERPDVPERIPDDWWARRRRVLARRARAALRPLVAETLSDGCARR